VTDRRSIGVDIGGTKIRAGLVYANGAVEYEVEHPTPSGGAAMAEIVVNLVETVLRIAPNPDDIEGCGIGTAGVVVDGRIVSANALLPGWAGTDIKGLVETATRLPTTVLNDVQAAAVCEARIGIGSHHPTYLVVSIGTGIGGALVVEGHVLTGSRGLAGSVGHIPAPLDDGDPWTRGRVCACGAIDHVEAYAGGRSIEDIFYEGTGERLNLREIASSAAAGDERAVHVITSAARCAGRAIGGSANVVDAEAVVLSGGVPEIGDLYMAALQAGVTAEAMSPRQHVTVLRSSFGSRAALVGAGLAALPNSPMFQAEESSL
jgi:glucokinase